MNKNYDNLIGQKFNRLLVLSTTIKKSGKKNRTALVCQCDCGNQTTVYPYEIIRNHTKSCGCFNKEKGSKTFSTLNQSKRKHAPHIASAMAVWKQRYKDGISFEDFFRLSQMSCYYCKKPPSNKYNKYLSQRATIWAKANGYFIHNGLDRLDSNKNHSIDNVVPCCKWCNQAKMTMTPNEFQEYLKQVTSHHLYGLTPNQLDEAVAEWKKKNVIQPAA